MTQFAKFAEIVDEAARTAAAIPQFTASAPLDVEAAYAIQALSLERRFLRGERLVGVKMGLTSRAKMIQVGVDEVIWGRLTDAMRLEEGGSLSKKRFPRCRRPSCSYSCQKSAGPHPAAIHPSHIAER